MIYLSTNTWMTSQETCFLCFVQHGARFLRLFRMKHVKDSKEVKHELFTKKEKWRNARQKEFLPTPTRNFHRAQCDIATKGSQFCKIFSRLLSFEQVKKLEDFSEKLTSKIKKKRINRGEKQRLKLKKGRVPSSLFLPHFDLICDLLLNRRTAAWNLFVN